jgi:hypothetical protein
MIEAILDAILDHPWRSLAIAVLAVVLFVYFGGCGREHFEPTVVVNTVFVPASVGYVYSKNGGTVYTPEQYQVVLKFRDGTVTSTAVDSSFWGAVHSGDAVEADCRWWGIVTVRVSR